MHRKLSSPDFLLVHLSPCDPRGPESPFGPGTPGSPAGPSPPEGPPGPGEPLETNAALDVSLGCFTIHDVSLALNVSL